jgi:hypothetical protein|tara:strand:+ start:16327 stop:16584 length:258 start_codon:yes stop_codon:yes gene_type:complete
MEIKSSDIADIQQDLWNVVSKYLGPHDSDAAGLFAVSGSMMKISLQLYTIVMKDQEIKDTLEEISTDLPSLRKKMYDKLGDRILH